MSELNAVIPCKICTCPYHTIRAGEELLLNDYVDEGEVLYFTSCTYCGYNGNATKLNAEQQEDRMIVILVEV